MDKLLERIKKNFNKNKWLLLAFIVLWIVSIIFTNNYFKSSLGKESYGGELKDTPIELNKDTEIEAIIPTTDKTDSVSILFATYARKNSGEINVVVEGVDTNIIYVDETINASMVEDNKHATFALDQQLSTEKDTKLKITLSSTSESDKAVGVYYYNEYYFEGSELKVNGEEVEGELCVRYLLQNDDLKVLSNQIITYSTIALTILALLLLLLEPSYDVYFTIAVIVFGLIMMAIITPMSPPDEELHYQYCFQLSNILMGDNENYIFIDWAYANDSYFVGHKNVGSAFIRLIRDFNKPLELTGEMFECNFDAEGSYIPYYVPQIIGITLGRLLKLNMLKTFYLGRLCNLIFYAACVYVAIKSASKHKVLFGIIATSPLFIQQAASYNYDGFIYGFCLILAGYLVKWMNNDELINKKDYIICLITSTLLAPAKIIYGVITLLFIFVPENRFGSKKKKIIMLLLLCSPSIAMILYNIWIRIEDRLLAIIVIHADDGDINDVFNVKLWTVPYILKYPWDTVMIIFRTIRYGIKMWFYDTMGHILSGHTLVLPIYLTYIQIVLTLAASLIKENIYYPVKFKIGIIVVCLAIGLLTLLAMLTGWTPRGAYLIDGIQGRYFCQIIPLFFMLFSNNKYNLPEKVSNYLLIVYVFEFYQIMMNVLSYTFVN